MRSREDILKEFSIFSIPTGGIGGWLAERAPDEVFRRLGKLDEEPLPAVQLNQLLVLAHEAPVGDDFFRYYWLEAPEEHPYNVRDLPNFNEVWLQSGGMITSLGHLKWGLYRLYVDGLLYIGDVRAAFRRLRDMPYSEIASLFSSKRFDTEAIKRRGPSLPFRTVAKDTRYLISEMACKSYGDQADGANLPAVLSAAYRERREAGKHRFRIRDLLGNLPTDSQPRQEEFLFSADEVLDEDVSSESEISAKFEGVARKFKEARETALDNTRYYLSMLGDLDVYVATSMRTRQDFRSMAETCDTIFADPRLREMNLRYFDPTLSAAGGHEDKGLIECLMVKCAKLLVYCAGEKESYGKDAEAAMALSLGKPVIFYCDQEQRGRFYRDVHPLSRLVEFETGVAVGAMVTDQLADVPELICRILENRMVYYLEQSKPGFLRLKEKVTDSVVRLQTNDQLLAEAFWNHYHKDRDGRRTGRP